MSRQSQLPDLTEMEDWEKELNEENEQPRADLIRGQLLAISRIKENMDLYTDSMMEWYTEYNNKNKVWNEEELECVVSSAVFEKVYDELSQFLIMYAQSINEDPFLKNKINLDSEEKKYEV